MTHLKDVVATSEAVGGTSSRLEKEKRLAEMLEALEAPEVPVVVPWLSGDLRQGRIGVGPSTLHRALSGLDSGSGSPGSASPDVMEVDAVFERIAGLSGSGSRGEMVKALRALFGGLTGRERDFVSRLLLGELRQGAQEGVVADAVARAVGVAGDRVRRAALLTGDVSKVATRVLEEGEEALARLSVRLFRPLRPMLARSAGSVEEALERMGTAAFEQKLDGARIQVHRRGDQVSVYTRRLNEETAALPEVVEAVLDLTVDEVVLDGEALALRPDGTPRPFQTTMRRFGRVQDVDRLREEVPLSCFFFDCLYLDGEALIDDPARIRFAALEERVPGHLRVGRLVTGEAAEARRFVREALEAGFEGAVAKDLEARYVAGRRGAAWLKLKPSYTLDLVVLAAEWGHGRRRGWLSNLHLGVRDQESGTLMMVGKTFKGMTDRMLRWQTERLRELAVAETDGTAEGEGPPGAVVRVRPELVVEIAFDGVQRSPRYPGGLALRFARVKRYREDKGPEEADTLQTLRAIHRGEITAF